MTKVDLVAAAFLVGMLGGLVGAGLLFGLVWAGGRVARRRGNSRGRS